NAVALRPMGAVVALRGRIDELVECSGTDEAVRIAVVGAGAGGVEVALAVDRRVRDGGGQAAVVLVDNGGQVPTGFSQRGQEKTMRILRERGIELQLERQVRGVSADAIDL